MLLNAHYLELSTEKKLRHLTPQTPGLFIIYAHAASVQQFQTIILVGLWLQAGDPSVYLYRLLYTTVIFTVKHLKLAKFRKLKVALKCRGIPSLFKRLTCYVVCKDNFSGTFYTYTDFVF